MFLHLSLLLWSLKVDGLLKDFIIQVYTDNIIFIVEGKFHSKLRELLNYESVLPKQSLVSSSVGRQPQAKKKKKPKK